MSQIELISRSEIALESWWEKLSPAEQRTVLIETQALSEEMVNFGMARLAIGQHLVALRDILEPKRIFTKYISRFPSFTVSSAYRWMDIYEDTKAALPEAVLRAALARGYDVIDLKLVEKNPPPKTANRVQIMQYLNGIHEKSKKEKIKAASVEVEYDEYTLLRESFNFVMSRLGRLPRPTKHQQTKALRDLVGLILTTIGIEEETSFSPIDVPEDMIARRGRPPLTADVV